MFMLPCTLCNFTFHIYLHLSCSTALCPDPADIVNATVTFTGNSVGDTAAYTCNSGFQLIGNASTTCTQVDVNSASFFPAAPVCRRECCMIMSITTKCLLPCKLYNFKHCCCSAALCPDPADIVNGTVTFTGNSVGDAATYTCNSGFELIGIASATCTQVDVNSASFFPAAPVCRREYCVIMSITTRCLCYHVHRVTAHLIYFLNTIVSLTQFCCESPAIAFGIFPLPYFVMNTFK